ncbi:hypothetical protein CDAR_250241 [Caerostris darwini]|uniref:Uncharacterized protein n=1 Tax=Caerostris darwini TaxID=1538125 RepID=A0AAV4QIZ8_9ARAC|nr:hypothetical protein CDAR_250241 [Caerostris darwini]
MDVFFRSFVNDSDLVCEISHSGPNRGLPPSFDSAPGHYKAAPPPLSARGGGGTHKNSLLSPSPLIPSVSPAQYRRRIDFRPQRIP